MPAGNPSAALTLSMPTNSEPEITPPKSNATELRS
jgi:hypothetical protein